jgi:hypothetical protein
MRPGDALGYHGDRAVLATMHGKEKVIAPLIERFLGLRVELVPSLNTDRFGTFTRDVERTGTQLDAARAKIEAAFALLPNVLVGLASEGSFGPHPFIPFLNLEREIVMLVDRNTGLELIGHHATQNTNYGHAVVHDGDDAHAFARRAGFPDHGIIVAGCRDGQPAPDIALIKDIATEKDLSSAIEVVVSLSGTAFVEADMRAHRNPKRMRAIKRATIDLTRRSRSLCPECRWPGFAVTERIAGLPCAWCDEPTLLTRAEVMSCKGCGWRDERAVAATQAEPAHCDSCNP